jgi:heme-degrading monooxygenase HmoA
MFVRTAHWTCRADKWAEALETFKTVAIPILERQPGFIKGQLVGEPDSYRRIAITVWQTQVDHDRFAVSADMATITEAFDPMYEEGVRPVGYAWPIIAQTKG